MHTFSAPNVAQDRLTVSAWCILKRISYTKGEYQIRPVAPVGLFGKGRASSPLRRRDRMYSMTLPATISLTSLRAVPDLSFSEVAFLNPRRPKQDTVAQPVPEKKRRRKDKTADAEEEISRFFKAKPPDQRGDVARRDQNSRRPSPTSCIAKGFEGTDRATTAPFLPPVELPNRPFLGFGGSGMNIISPVKVTVSADAPCRMVTPGRPRSSTRSSIGSSSYYTWTATPSSKIHGQCSTDGTSGEVCRDPQKTRKACLSSMAHCQSSLEESGNDKALHIDPETNHKSLENQDLNLNNAPPHKSHLVEEGQPEKTVCSGQRPRSGAATHVSSLADGEPADSVPDQNLGKEADDQADNECQGATKLEAKEQFENDFPILFDEALERLFEACNFPSYQLQNSINTPRMSKHSDQIQYRDRLDSSFKTKNVGKLGRNFAPKSQSINFCKEHSKTDLGLQSPSFTITNQTTYSATSPLGNDNGNHSTSLVHIGRGSEPPTEVPARSISTQETDVHMAMLRRGRRHPSEFQGILSSNAWRGYRNIYHDQLFPDVEACSNENDISNVKSSFNRRGGTWPTHQNDSAKDIFEASQGADEESLPRILQDVQNRPDSYDDDTHYRQPNSYPLYDESQHCRAPDYGDATSDLVDNTTVPASSLATTKRMEMPSETLNLTTSAVSTEHYGDHDIQNGHRQLDYDEPCDAHWAGFWRPNKLY